MITSKLYGLLWYLAKYPHKKFLRHELKTERIKQNSVTTTTTTTTGRRKNKQKRPNRNTHYIYLHVFLWPTYKYNATMNPCPWWTTAITKQHRQNKTAEIIFWSDFYSIIIIIMDFHVQFACFTRLFHFACVEMFLFILANMQLAASNYTENHARDTLTNEKGKKIHGSTWDSMATHDILVHFFSVLLVCCFEQNICKILSAT